MKSFLTFCLLIISFSIVAQKQKKKSSGLGNLLVKADAMQKSANESDKKARAYADSLRQVRPGYEAKNNTYYNYDLADFPLNGYYIKNNGEEVEAIIAYQRPQFLMGLSNSLMLCKEATGKKVDALNSHLEPNFKEWVKYDDIKAFYVADQLYVKNTDDYFTTLVSEGAIHTSTSGTLIDVEAQLFKVYPVTQKLNGRKFGTVNRSISEEEILAMMTDAPEIVAGFRNGEYPIIEAEIRYNIWYEDNYPGKVKYIFGKDYGVDPTTLTVTTTEVSDYEKEIISAADEASRAPEIDKFAGRPTTAAAAVASAKPEVTVKKESFMDRLKRIKADGNKVGVLVTSKNLNINPGSFSEGITKAQVMGSYGPLEGLDNLSKSTASQLNAGFGLDVFEAVDYSQIPYKEGKYGKLDDWWSTKYKIIVLYELAPYYNAYYKITDATSGTKSYFAQMKVDSDMIVMAAENEKPDKLKYVTSTPKTWGTYRSEKVELPATTDFNIIQELKAAIEPPTDDEVIEALISSQKEALTKFVKKKSK